MYMSTEDNKPPRVIQVDAETAVLNFNFVEGHVYRNNDGVYHVPAHNGIQDWVCDCWEIPGDDWDDGVRPQNLQEDGQLPVPVRTEDLGHSVGWLDELPPPCGSLRVFPFGKMR